MKKVKASMTVEMAYIMPIVLLVFLLVIYAVFYCHDKNILIGAAGETAVLGAQQERKKEEAGQTDLSAFGRERAGGKMILFSGVEVSVSKSGDRIEVSMNARRGRMQISVVQRAQIPRPEKKIRQKRKLETLAK